jgi:hypothetical protein
MAHYVLKLIIYQTLNTIIMITVTIGQYIKCNTTGLECKGVLERILDLPEDKLLGWGSDYGLLHSGDRVNLHNCVA